MTPSRAIEAAFPRQVPVLRDVNDVAEIIGQIAHEPIQILCSPRIVNLADDGLRIGHRSSLDVMHTAKSRI
jgi:hypothetical protein